jgi:hypothetical protein
MATSNTSFLIGTLKSRMGSCRNQGKKQDGTKEEQDHHLEDGHYLALAPA